MINPENQSKRAQAIASVFAASPLFSGLVLADPGPEHLELIELPAGEILFRKGDRGMRAFLVAQGVLGLDGSDDCKEAHLFRKACRGELIGEYALLCDEPRSATARALVDCTLFAIDQDCLRQLLKLDPEVPSRLIRQLAQDASLGREDLSTRPLITVLAPSQDMLQRQDQGMEQLIAALRDGNSAAIEDHRAGPWSCSDQAAVIVHAHEQRQPTVIVINRLSALDLEHWPLIDRALLVSRCNAVLPSDMEAVVTGSSCGATTTPLDLVRIWPAEQERPESLERLGLLRELRHIYNIREGHAADYRRTARCILGRANILVLGGGGAKGFAHVGALQALQEQEQLEIDMVVGISIGSFIGSLYALEYSIDEIRRILMETFVKTSPYSLTLPIHSLFRYNHHIRAAEKIYGDLEVADTWIPFRPGSVDLTSNQLVFSHRHSLMRTVIASMSIPGLMPPTPLPTGGLHVDGAVLNNVPIMEARRWTTGKVIAISLDHGEGQRAVLTIGKQHFWLWRLLLRLGIVRGDLPSITITILQSMLCSAREKSDKEELFADLMLKPNLADIGILEWSAHQKVELEGYRATRDQLGRTCIEATTSFQPADPGRPEQRIYPLSGLAVDG